MSCSSTPAPRSTETPASASPPLPPPANAPSPNRPSETLAPRVFGDAGDGEKRRGPEGFRRALASRLLLFDGAMGTMIYASGVYINQSYDNLNLVRPHLVKNIHQQYLAAGAEVLETNTFGANRSRLAGHGLGDKVREINMAGARLAREVAHEAPVWVAGALGPLADRLAPGGPLSPAQAREHYREQARALLDGEVDLLVFESFDDLSLLVEAVRAARELDAEIPVVAQMRFDESLRSRQGGHEPEHCAEVLAALPVDAVGANCASAIEILQTVERMRSATRLPLSAQPNLGAPKAVEDRVLYMATPEYLMEYTRRMIQKGACIIGACCGSTPDHIRSIRSSIRMIQPGVAGGRDSAATPSGGAGNAVLEIGRPSEAPPGSRAEVVAAPVAGRSFLPRGVETPSRLAARVREGRFVVSVEIDPPVGTDPAHSLAAAAVCRDAGIDCINIADGPRASARMGPVAMALLLRRDVPGIEPIVHFCCRDRNLLAMQADLIGANALGLPNVLMITGDPPKLGDYPHATAVYDVDAIGALAIAANLNSGCDLAGNPLRGPATGLFTGCGANPGAIDLDVEIERLERKAEAGAEYILTQPVYDARKLEAFLERTAHVRLPLLLGILPLASYRNAEFLTREVPGMEVPRPILDRMKRWEDKDSARREGVAIAQEALAAAHAAVAGVYIMPPFNRVDAALDVLLALPEEKRPRPPAPSAT